MAERFLCQKQLAKRWGISHRTLESWRYRGIGLPYLKLGGRIVYRIGDIEAYEAQQTHGGFEGDGDPPVRFEDVDPRHMDGGRC
ncbi:helix-turn-helix transcriptional regulator [Paramagnetospirillum magneticum]|uniref:helix-turn-helix transcriptional regulator n=1 Tax=Paramagnetospirillum magneticum TaxID=84159 RepID=UPI0005C1C186|nr:helix-turn-helix domain-containing protein [Paramagnetospirillum magneticum]